MICQETRRERSGMARFKLPSNFRNEIAGDFWDVFFGGESLGMVV